MSISRKLDFFIGVPLVKLFSALFGKKLKTNEGIRKILIIKLAAAGDTILLLTALDSFRKKHPGKIIHWLVSPINSYFAKTSECIDRIFIWDRKWGISLFALIHLLRQEKYDLIIDMEQWSRGTTLLSFLSGARHRWGFDTPGQYRDGLYTRAVRKNYEQHELHDFVQLLSLLGELDPISKTTIKKDEFGENELYGLLQKLRVDGSRHPWIIIHPGCGSDGLPREWPLVSYSVLIHWLIKNYKSTVFLTGGPEEMKKTAQLSRLVNGQAVNLGGRLTWGMMVALLSKADLVISGNTGAMHIAAALERKQVALHGPTNPRLWGPLNSHAKVIQSSCEHCPCLKLGFEYHTLDQSCMARIDVEEVKRAVQSLIDIRS